MTTGTKLFIGVGLSFVIVFIILGYIFDAPNILKVIIADRKLQKINYCNQKSECIEFGYNNGCNFAPINYSSKDEALKITQNVHGNLYCDYFSRNVDFTCENHKCILHKKSTP